MNDFQKRMSSSGLTSYIRSNILTYDSLDSYFSDEDEQIEVKGKYLPGYASFQRSVDRYLIGEKRNISRSAYQVRSAVLRSFSLKDNTKH